MKKEIFLVVPKIIEQPTWGGDYILNFKDWSQKKPFSGLTIGQSYELFSGTKLRKDLESSQDDSFVGELGHAMEPDKFVYHGDEKKLITLEELISDDPVSILGENVIKKHGPKMKVLIKFTQAKGNSFQLHVQEKSKSKKWLPKPESWYYFEPGLITLGLRRRKHLDQYKNACLKIEQESKRLGKKVAKKKLPIIIAREKIESLIKNLDFWQYVNLLEVESEELIDLSRCGLHHSWEENDEKFPLGNVVYELCLDVMDPVSSIRSFDKGKIKEDGEVRDVHVEDYFKHVDTSDEINHPNNHRAKGKQIFKNKTLLIELLMRSKWYCLDIFKLNGKYTGRHTDTTKTGFHHLFVKKGSVTIKTTDSKLLLTQGHSCFIPATVGQYVIESTSPCEILKTFIY